jgi:hypothetical protein
MTEEANIPTIHSITQAAKPWKRYEDGVTVDAIVLLGTRTWKTTAEERDLGGNGS